MLLLENEILLLFVVVLSGLLLGHLKIGGARLGIAGVLFAGLAWSSWVVPDGKRLHLAPELKEFGLVLFVYCVGLTSGPGFFSTWRRGGARLNVVVLVALLGGGAIALLGGRALNLDPGQIAGVFCGALTNTPALGAATDKLAHTAFALQPVVGYSATYPFGVLGALLSFRLFSSFENAALTREKAQSQAARSTIITLNVRVTNPAVVGHSIGELRVRDKLGVMLSRVRRDDEVFVPTKYTVLSHGDVVVAAGDERVKDAVLAFFGELCEEHVEAQRQVVDMRRVLVSKREHVGKTPEELELAQRFNAQVTRIRRADIDIVAAPDTKLELGDRLRVVAPVSQLPKVSAFFGDSERELAEVDFLALSIGLTAGLLLAAVPFSLFGTELKLGAAGGPLVLALTLGRLARTGPFVWTIPYETNKALRELGLLLFLAGVGINAGASLRSLFTLQGLTLVGLGAVVTIVSAAIVLLGARRWAKSTVIGSIGAASGMQTQPATLEAAYEMSGKSPETYVAYALVYPASMIGKILIAQLLAVLA